MKYVVKNRNTQTVDVELEQTDEGVLLKAGGYCVLTLKHSGGIQLHGGMSQRNEAGLLIDKDGGVLVER